MTYRINFLFLFIAELLDVLFGTLFPSDLLKMSTSIIFQFQFIALILIGRKLNKFDDFILAFILGCYNSLHLGYFSFVIGLIYWVVLYLVKQIFPNGNESLIEYVIILILNKKEKIIWIMLLFYCLPYLLKKECCTAICFIPPVRNLNL